MHHDREETERDLIIGGRQTLLNEDNQSMAKNNPMTRAKHRQAWDFFCTQHFLEAKRLYKQICDKDRIDENAWAMLGIVLGNLGELDESIGCLERALAINPSNFDALKNLALAFYNKGTADRAITYCQRALAIRREHIDTLVTMGNAYARMDLLTQAQQCYERILTQDPKHAAALGNLANVLAYQGNAELALPYFREAIANNRSFSGLHSNLLLCLHYLPTHDPLTVFREHLEWATLHAPDNDRHPVFSTERNPDRKLRLGYVTPDLRGHSVAYFLEPLLASHDRNSFDVTCYVELGVPDKATERLWKLADNVRNTHGLSDDTAAAMIRHDQIDILIDLAGHTDHNRLPMFSHRPAPIQMTYLGYPNTTGMHAIDYRLTDEWADPPGMTERFHTEKLIRLEKGFLCFSPPAESPAISPLPSIERSYVTFGSFNVLTKITHEMLITWADLLREVPSSRLLIKNRQLTDKLLQTRLYAFFEEHGVARERVELLGRTSKEEHMASYGKVDIALDTFPYHGTTTTCDTLWMGIPVVSLGGQSHVSRVGVSLLTKVGMSDLIARSRQEYIDCAVKLARSPQRLRHLRENLRKMVEESGLTNGLAFTRKLEETYRRIWKGWCNSNEE